MGITFWSVLFATWLFISAFALPHTDGSAAFTAGAAIAVGAVAIAAPGRPALRFLVSGVALAACGIAVIMPGVPDIATLNHAIVAPILLVLSSLKANDHRVTAASRAA